MRLLFDANLSSSLVTHLQAEYPNSVHVRDVGLREASDSQIWEFAKANEFVIISKDTDFRERSFVEGFPPKVIWLDVGNASTMTIVDMLRRHRTLVTEFIEAPDESLLFISIEGGAV